MTARPTRTLVARGRSLWAWTQRSRPWRAFSHFTDVGGSVLTGGMSYQALFAVFAGLFVGFSVFSIALNDYPELLDTIVEQINVFIPGLLGEGPEYAVSVEALLAASSTLSWASVIGSITLLWVAINWFTGTRRSIRIIFGLEVKQYRNAALLKVLDFVLAIVFSLAIVVSAALTVISSNLANTIISWFGADPDGWFFGTMGAIVRYGAMYLFDVLVLIAIHRYLAEVRIGLWNLVTGCMLGAAALFGLKVLGTALLGGATSNPLFATFVVFVALLIWFNFICRALLLTSSWIATGLDPNLGAPEASAGRSALAFLE